MWEHDPENLPIFRKRIMRQYNKLERDDDLMKKPSRSRGLNMVPTACWHHTSGGKQIGD
jgi:hypothetical protein